MCISKIIPRSFVKGTSGMAAKVDICPTSPLVPIPEPRGVFSSLKTIVETGPRIADESIGGIIIRGFLTMLGICSMDVPRFGAVPSGTSKKNKDYLNKY